MKVDQLLIASRLHSRLQVLTKFQADTRFTRNMSLIASGTDRSMSQSTDFALEITIPQANILVQKEIDETTNKLKEMGVEL